jgi:hypothetical protein
LRPQVDVSRRHRAECLSQSRGRDLDGVAVVVGARPDPRYPKIRESGDCRHAEDRPRPQVLLAGQTRPDDDISSPQDLRSCLTGDDLEVDGISALLGEQAEIATRIADPEVVRAID